MIGDFIKAKRLSLNMTQTELSKMIGISEVQIRNLEKNRNKANLKTLYKYAEALNVNFEELYNLNEEK